MARDHQNKRRIGKMPDWKQDRANCNPTAKYRRRWRQKYRAYCKRAMLANDPVISTHKKVTSIREWY